MEKTCSLFRVELGIFVSFILLHKHKVFDNKIFFNLGSFHEQMVPSRNPKGDRII